MKNHMISSLETLNLIRVNDADNFKEVQIATKLPKEIEREYNLNDYDISVRFHQEGEIDVFVFDNEEEGTRNVIFTPTVRNELITFAEKQL